MKAGIVTNELFEVFVADYQRTDLQDLDPRMRRIIPRFNQIPYVVSRFSCSGHFKKENPQGGSCTPHLIFVAKERLDDILFAFQSWVDGINPRIWALYRPSISLINLMSLGTGGGRYWAWKIEFHRIPHGSSEALHIEKVFLELVEFLHGSLK